MADAQKTVSFASSKEYSLPGNQNVYDIVANSDVTCNRQDSVGNATAHEVVVEFYKCGFLHGHCITLLDQQSNPQSRHPRNVKELMRCNPIC